LFGISIWKRRNKIYLFVYFMIYETFMYLIKWLESSVKYKFNKFVKASQEFIKTIILQLCLFAYEVSANIIFDIFNIRIIVMLILLLMSYFLKIFIYIYTNFFMSYVSLRYWEEFFMHLIYLMCVMPLIVHIFYFIKSWISGLL
jgi:hypothetical protein